jgi:hypothetical protein
VDKCMSGWVGGQVGRVGCVCGCVREYESD